MLIDELINSKESLTLEFKSQWYWAKDEKPKDSDWGEFLKDFASLANCSAEHVGDIKYLIIGVDETKDQKSGRYINVDTIDSTFLACADLKERINEKLINFFNCEEKESIPDYELFFHKVNESNLLVFKIKQINELLVLAKEIVTKNRSERKNIVFLRSTKINNEPEIINASPEHLSDLTDKIKIYNHKRKKEHHVEKSVEKTISSFIKHNSAYSLGEVKREKIWKEGVMFELYPAISNMTSNINFIYLYEKANQTRTYDYLIENKLIDDSIDKIILIDDGLKKDLNGITTKFKAKGVYSLGSFALEFLYKSQLSDYELFHDGEFKKQRQIKNFIPPCGNNNKGKTATALLSLNNWFECGSRPLMVIKGYGGVGKTTLVKYFLDDVHAEFKQKKSNAKILFIDSKKIINQISRTGNIDNLFAFYSAYAQEHDISHRFNKELLELSIDNGDLLIVLDGIDEVIAKLNGKFDVKGFISSIFENYLLGGGRAKIIITCRDYFWESNNERYFSDIDSLEVLPFTESLAMDFFEKEFERKSKDFNKCVELSKEFKLASEEEDVYIPYILDIIMDMVKQQKELGSTDRSDIKSKILITELTEDYFIGRICNREIQKLNNIDIDCQLSFFMNMAVIFDGVTCLSNRGKLFRNTGIIESEDIFNLFKGHPLILFNAETQNLEFKYDYFREYFHCLYVYQFFLKMDIDLFDDNIKEIISDNVRFDSGFTKSLCDRLKLNDELKLFCIELASKVILNLKQKENILERRILSSILIVLWGCLRNSGKFDTENRTSLVRDVFGEGFSYLSIINVFSEINGVKPTINFSGETITNAWFESYNFMWENKFDSNTIFSHCMFKDLDPRPGVSLPVNLEKMFVDCDTTGIRELLEKETKSRETKTNSIKEDVLNIFSLFDVGGHFKGQKCEMIHKRANSRILDVLLKNKVVKKFIDRSKPTMTQYTVADEYHNIIKILDQRGTCLELMRVLSFFE